jgi:hypothetical protein
MEGSLFWLSDAAWAAIEPHLPMNQPGARRVDDRRAISGIVQSLRSAANPSDIKGVELLVGNTARMKPIIADRG